MPGAGCPGSPAPEHPAVVMAGREFLTGPAGEIPRVAGLAPDTAWLPLGTLDGVPVWGAAVASTEGLPGRWLDWRAYAAEVPEPLAALAGRALQVVTWRAAHRYCGSCRTELTDVPGEAARRCPDCDRYLPMQLSPAVVAAVTRPGTAGAVADLLLVRHAYGPTRVWALVAGYVEVGESLEAAVRREVAEEVGLDVGEPVYFGSQPWAMSGPGVTLAGFTAPVTDPAAEPVVDGRELVEARWFPLDALPEALPPAYSISRWLIDATVARATRRS
ncbi:NAD(+) diphosphatase [Micromonospora fluostatini]|uniref:NAD(+) diphosphatase n=1 Tax=Micromonospora sp. JCM 30529 TaxID=3421643 RepID=UPI003D168252